MSGPDTHKNAPAQPPTQHNSPDHPGGHRIVNIALMNETALIFGRMNIGIMEGIEASSTKWNFNVYYPGVGVGGHCLPVDPYYLVTKA